jgi:hypothetical protein
VVQRVGCEPEHPRAVRSEDGEVSNLGDSFGGRRGAQYDGDAGRQPRPSGSTPPFDSSEDAFGVSGPDEGFGIGKGGILDALRRSPLVGADLDLSRSKETGRNIES